MKTISSPMTFVFKYLFSAAWIGGFGSAALVLVFDSTAEMQLRLLVFSIWAIGTCFLFIMFRNLKKVQLTDDQKILVTDLFTKENFHLKEIISVSGSHFQNPEVVTIVIKNSTGQKKVAFIPPFRFHFGFTQHPIAKKLRRLARIARSN